MSQLLMILLTSSMVGAPDEPVQAAPLPSPVRTPTPVEFKLRFWHYGVAKEPLEAGELVAIRGRVYQFFQRSDEVVILDASKKRIYLIDLGLKRMTDLAYTEVEEAMIGIREEMTEFIADSEKKKTRAGRIAAEMQRNLRDPQFRATFNEADRRLTLANPNVQVDAVGQVEPDPARLAVVGETLTLVTKLRALRESGEFSPFPQIEALASLIKERKLRPGEMTFLFRLAGPPEKHRWSYELDPTIPDRERTALEKIDELLLKTRRLDFDRYERRLAPADIP